MRRDGAKGQPAAPAPQSRALPNCAGKHVALVAARFYGELSDLLIEGAKRALRDCGVADSDVDVFHVPGCFELPLACRNLFDSQRYHGLVALGVDRPRRHPALRIRRGRMCARPHGRAAVHRRADRIRGADDRHVRTSAGTGRPQARKQGLRSSGRRCNDADANGRRPPRRLPLKHHQWARRVR